MSALLSIQALGVTLGARETLSDVSLQASSGDVIALLGANGAGKTTLLRAALGLVAARSGEVLLGDANPRMLTPRARALRAAYMPQKPSAAWPLTVEALVALGRFVHGGAPDRRGARDQAAVDAALSACSLVTLRERRLDEISGGERMRAHLARTLAQGAPLLLLDEPTAGLDPAQALGFAEIARAHSARGAVVFATHDITLAAQTANRVYLMAQGRLTAEGAVLDVLTPQNLETVYGRAGALERVGENYVALFR